MRASLRTKGPRTQHSTVVSVPAPIGGWNERDSLANMPPTDAVKLENWFPTTVDCEIRGGTAAYSTGITGAVETLATYTAMDGTEKFFAVTDTDCYNITNSGAGTAQTWTDQDNGKYQWLNMGNGTDNWLMMFNGEDLPKYYDGTNWVEVTGATSPAITGLTTTTIVAACQYHGRLFFVQNNTLSIWYLPAGVVGGAATEFDLSPYAHRGGYVMWAATWTHDGGDGIDDYIVFMTSEGEAIVYTGTNPGSSTSWARLGTFFIGKPLGRRSFIKYGGDLLIITQDGIFPISQALEYSQINERTAITDKIKKAFNDAARDEVDSFGWEITHYPQRNALIVNVPISLASQQYVVNTVTGAWCKFTGWDTEVFGIYNNELYFGGSTVVTKAWTGVSDSGSDITAEAKTAFNGFGNVGMNKRFTMYRPMLKVDNDLSYLTDIEIDFQEKTITGEAVYTASTAGRWDSATWDSGVWGGSEIIRKWASPDCDVGYYAAAKMKISTSVTRVNWFANDFVFESGGVV